ncbi:zinc finger protein 239-like isoform X2 [Diabrotica virgifera virgifera]|uniref:C2H2-type domain-containing protein n=1 Tax=Diabrotica virgifera virgifera TaxID=50390 RepID=A0ABM5K025_DIAVI|nr:zinc finger protein 239-like isoform X2 [Diabrotica virgifera virgifera]
MEVKQEVSDKTFQAEIYCNDVDDDPLDICKIKIKEEPLRESTHDTFDYVDLKDDIKTELKQEEHKLPSSQERHTNPSCFPPANALENMKTISVLTCNKEEHMSQPVQENVLKCDVCGQCDFVNRSSFIKHMKIHTGEKPYKCEICFKKFTKTSVLKIHMRVHTGEKPYKCEICFRQFSNGSNLKKHLRVHTGENVRLHTGETPYKCEICFKQFAERRNLNEHINVHTGEKPFKCEICFRQFGQKGSLNRHTRMHSRDALQV